jgi:hypothetical protein
MMMDNIIEGIFTLMQKDDEDPMKQSEILEITYNKATQDEKKIIDDIMICVCGYSLDTILNRPEEIQV